jgi:hypothetical protein
MRRLRTLRYAARVFSFISRRSTASSGVHEQVVGEAARAASAYRQRSAAGAADPARGDRLATAAPFTAPRRPVVRSEMEIFAAAASLQRCFGIDVQSSIVSKTASRRPLEVPCRKVVCSRGGTAALDVVLSSKRSRICPAQPDHGQLFALTACSLLRAAAGCEECWLLRRSSERLPAEAIYEAATALAEVAAARRAPALLPRPRGTAVPAAGRVTKRFSRNPGAASVGRSA